MRYFKAPTAVNAAVRNAVMQQLGHPNGRADEPWHVDGDFVVDGFVYLGLGPHHTTGDPWAGFIDQALAAGVVEITEAQYIAARPIPEEII